MDKEHNHQQLLQTACRWK